MKTSRQILTAIRVEIARIHSVKAKPTSYWFGRFDGLKDLLDWIERPKPSRKKVPKRGKLATKLPLMWPSDYLRKKR